MSQEKKLTMPKNTDPLLPVNELVMSSWNLFREKFRLIIFVSLLGLLASLAFTILMTISSAVFGHYSNFIMINICLMLLLFIPLLYVSFRINIAVYLIVSQKTSDLKNAWQTAGKYFWSYALTMFWAGLMISVWFALLIVPGFIFLVFYSLVLWVFFMENYHGYAALQRSRELVTGYWWPVALRLLFLLVPLLLYSIVVNVIAKEQVANFITSIFDYFFGIFTIIYTYYLYQNLLKLKGASKIPHKHYKPWVYVAIMVTYVILFIAIFLSAIFSTANLK